MIRFRSRLQYVMPLILLLPLAACDKDCIPAALETAIEAEDWREIEVISAALPRTDAHRADIAALRGYAALARGDTSVATRHFQSIRARDIASAGFPWLAKLAARDTTSPTAQLLTGYALARERDPRGIEWLEQALARQPDSQLARLTLGIALAVAGRNDDALRQLETVDATDPAGIVARALTLLAANQTELVPAELTRSAATAPSDALLFNTLGAVAARGDDWVLAAHDFERAFQLMPDLDEARANWTLARSFAAERGTVISQIRYLGIFGPGIMSEGDTHYAVSHADHLLPADQSDFLYVGIKGNFPLGGLDKATAQGYRTLTIDPGNPEPGMRGIDQFIAGTLAHGRDPALIIDINKIVPSQLGNLKSSALDLPAQIIDRSNQFFKSATAAADLKGITTVDAHSDFTYPAVLGTLLAAKTSPIDRLVLESVRSEDYLRQAVSGSPHTQVIAVQSAQGDLWTLEAQGRAIALQPGAYKATIDAYKSIDAPNFRLVLIDNGSGFKFGIPAAHGDAADYDRPSQVSLYAGSQKIGSEFGKLGDLLARNWGTYATPSNDGVSTLARGGVYLSASPAVDRKIRLVYPLFGCVSCDGLGN